MNQITSEFKQKFSISDEISQQQQDSGENQNEQKEQLVDLFYTTIDVIKQIEESIMQYEIYVTKEGDENNIDLQTLSLNQDPTIATITDVKEPLVLDFYKDQKIKSISLILKNDCQIKILYKNFQCWIDLVDQWIGTEKFKIDFDPYITMRMLKVISLNGRLYITNFQIMAIDDKKQKNYSILEKNSSNPINLINVFNQQLEQVQVVGDAKIKYKYSAVIIGDKNRIDKNKLSENKNTNIYTQTIYPEWIIIDLIFDKKIKSISLLPKQYSFSISFTIELEYQTEKQNKWKPLLQQTKLRETFFSINFQPFIQLSKLRIRGGSKKICFKEIHLELIQIKILALQE